MSDTTRPRLVIIGPPGAGKTSVGRVLAARWGVEFRDSDADIEVAAGKPVSDIFVDDGEAVFRRIESSLVSAALDSHDGVLALGGGAVVDSDTRQTLVGRRVVFLDVGLAAAASRVGLGTTRPLLLGNVRTQLKTLLDARRPLYREAAWLTVVTDDLSVDEVADAVEDALDAKQAP
ncbi:MAG: shikimate kinase [Propionibacteriales bacterium]|nr:shikimate kinase [Propionibacteriales bacterium]